MIMVDQLLGPVPALQLVAADRAVQLDLAPAAPISGKPTPWLRAAVRWPVPLWRGSPGEGFGELALTGYLGWEHQWAWPAGGSGPDAAGGLDHGLRLAWRPGGAWEVAAFAFGDLLAIAQAGPVRVALDQGYLLDAGATVRVPTPGAGLLLGVEGWVRPTELGTGLSAYSGTTGVVTGVLGLAW